MAAPPHTFRKTTPAEPDSRAKGAGSSDPGRRLLQLEAELESLRRENAVLRRARAEHEKTESALKESEARYRELVENAGSIILRYDAGGRITFFNEFAEKFFGFSRDEVLERPAVGSIIPARESTGRDLDQMVRDIVHDPDRYCDNENENIRKNGERVWVRWTNKPIFNPDGSVREFLAIGTDITERKRVEQSLEESRRYFQAIVQGSPIPTFVMGRDHTITLWNQALEDYSGVKAEEMLGRSMAWKAFYPDERPVLTDFIVDDAIDQIPRWYEGKYAESTLVNGAFEGTDFFPTMKGGRCLYFTAAPIRDAEGRIVGAVEILQDVTERKHAEEAVHFERNQLFSILDGLEVSVYISDPETHEILYVNPHFARMLGVVPDNPEEP
jgi:PAS domain S-box-containing protein